MTYKYEINERGIFRIDEDEIVIISALTLNDIKLANHRIVITRYNAELDGKKTFDVV